MIEWDTIILSSVIAAIIGILVAILFRYVMRPDIEKVFESNYDSAMRNMFAIIYKDYLIMTDVYKIIDSIYEQNEKEFLSNIIFSSIDGVVKPTYTIMKLNSNQLNNIVSLRKEIIKLTDELVGVEFFENYLGMGMITEMNMFLFITSEFLSALINHQRFDFMLLNFRKEHIKNLIEDYGLYRNTKGEIVDEWKYWIYKK